MMSTYDNAPALDGWSLPPRHCGEFCEDRSCHVCAMDVVRHPQVPPNVELAEN